MSAQTFATGHSFRFSFARRTGRLAKPADSLENGAPGETRTRAPRLRRPVVRDAQEGPAFTDLAPGNGYISSGYLLRAIRSQVDQLEAGNGESSADLDPPLITDPRAPVEDAGDSRRRVCRPQLSRFH